MELLVFCFEAATQCESNSLVKSVTKSAQIITFTFPHIGIVGTNDEDLESQKIYAEGCIINQQITDYSNWRAQKSLNFFLNHNKIPAITNIDTRYLTRNIKKREDM